MTCDLADVSQEVAEILLILSLILEGAIGLDINRHLRSIYIIGTEEYEWEENIQKVIPIEKMNYTTLIRLGTKYRGLYCTQ